MKNKGLTVEEAAEKLNKKETKENKENKENNPLVKKPLLTEKDTR